MSDFDSNPFADPEAGSPFSDPSVRQATQSAPHGGGGIEEYNPFADGNKTTAQTAAPPPPQQQYVPPPQPAVMPATQEQPPPYSASPQINTQDLQRRQEELERKAAELQKKEEEMRNMQQGIRKNNFPPLPAACCVQPCFYQDFAVDIPLEFQKIVKIIYYLWIAYAGLLCLNLIGSLAYLIGTLQDDEIHNSSGVTFGLSILWLILFTPCSFVCWYRPVYKAFRSDSSFNFFFFFFVFFFQFCASIIQCLGIDGSGTVGLISGLSMVTQGSGGAVIAGIIMLLVGLCFGLMSLSTMILLIKVHRIYRSTGASFEKAQAEFAQGVMSNKTVQTTASQAAASAGRAAVDQTLSGNNRY